MTEFDYIKQGDCLQLMKELPDGCVDMVLCDLPYGTTACKWDSVIPFDPLWGQYKRVVKKHGAIVLFAAQPFTSVLVASNIKNYKAHYVWDKCRGTGFQVAKYRPMMQTEDIIVFSANGDRVNFYPQMIRLPHSVKRSYASSTNGANPLANFNKGSYMTNEAYPTNLLSFPKDPDSVHPTQKPLQLLQYLILTYSNEGDLILDNTMGSGSTCVAAIKEHRHFIGYELTEEYFNIAKKRIDLELMQPTLF